MAPVNLWSIVATEDSKRDLSYMKWVCQIFHFVNDDSHQKEKILISLPSNRRKAVYTVRRTTGFQSGETKRTAHIVLHYRQCSAGIQVLR